MAKKKWTPLKIIGCSCAGLFFLGVLGIGSLVFGVFSLLKSSEPYKKSLDLVKNHPEVIELIGTPIEEGLMISGSINTTNDKGNADISYPVKGPKGEGTVYAIAERNQKKWTLQEVTFYHEVSDQRIQILP